MVQRRVRAVSAGLASAVCLVCVMQAKAGLDRSKFNIGAYDNAKKPEWASSSYYRDLKECGIDFVIDFFRNNPKSQALLTANGMGCVELDIIPGYFGGKTEVNGNIARLSPVEEFVTKIKAHEFTPAEWFCYFGDELSALDFPHLGAAARAMHKYLRGRPLYLNLHPSWHKNGNIKTYLGAKDYREYIAAYCRDLPLDYISYDHYPYQWVNDRDWAFARYFENFRIVADACTATGRSFWFIPQVNTLDVSVDITEQKLRYQAFAAMAFGAESLAWACWSPVWWENNVLDKEGRKTRQYGRLKKVNAEIKRIAEKYMRFRRLDTHFTGFAGRAAKWLEQDPDNGLPKLNFNEPDGVSTLVFRNVRADDGKALVVGDFIERAGRRRAMLVFAAEDPFEENFAERTIRFETEHMVRAVGPDGEIAIGRTDDRVRTLRIRSCGCAFVVAD